MAETPDINTILDTKDLHICTHKDELCKKLWNDKKAPIFCTGVELRSHQTSTHFGSPE
jgi:hypothetical protein